MRKFVADMNRVIKLVWTYPLEIKPCALESEGSLVLNYKFPIVVDKDSSTRKDVSLGSSAMLEIFDLVFRVCAAKAIGLGKLPLLLDEFGKGFDNVHKSSIGAHARHPCGFESSRPNLCDLSRVLSVHSSRNQ